MTPSPEPDADPHAGPQPEAGPGPRAGQARRTASALAHGASRTGRIMGRGALAGARLAGRGSRAGARRARAYTHSAGAGESGLARLVELHFVTGCADAALTVSLAGTIFAMPTDEARGQVAQFLLLTMAPFAVLAPFVGPLLDRFRNGRRWAIGTTLAVRAFLSWVLAGVVTGGSPWLFPAALGCLVASKAYGVSRSSAVPRVLPPGFSLVKANSRQALAGVASIAVGGGLAGALARVGAEWSLRFAFLIYVAGTVLAIRLPARIDSNVGERYLEDTVPVEVGEGGPPRGRGARAWRARIAALPTTVRASFACAVGARLLTGFLTLFMTFLMREHPLPGYGGTVVLALVAGAAGLGNAAATLVGNALGRRRPDLIVSVDAHRRRARHWGHSGLLLPDDPAGPRPGRGAVGAADQPGRRRDHPARHRRVGPHPHVRLVGDGASDRLGGRGRHRHHAAAGPPPGLRRDLRGPSARPGRARCAFG